MKTLNILFFIYFTFALFNVINCGYDDDDDEPYPEPPYPTPEPPYPTPDPYPGPDPTPGHIDPRALLVEHGIVEALLEEIAAVIYLLVFATLLLFCAVQFLDVKEFK
ncbi:hypothetical protein Mgra_00006134 [Meloidogyne graminicola]|uniref:Uncharacterized protein n=1 Tax=Meloidogyne graminicola TaxID=189291 RepID=A0A8S9ZME8_9BILA|nr:hypothetical protein Mgra_00006134 [Meloidogyne graminicola]